MADPSKHQAVALRSDGDMAVYYKCSFVGYQDTLYAMNGRQFYRECDVYGSVDFIFGDGSAVFQNCNIHVHYNLNGGTSVITAQGRNRSIEKSGFSIHNSNVIAAADLKGTKIYLGRPWGHYARAVFMKTALNDIVHPEGWLQWEGRGTIDEDTLYFGEYNNKGPSASTTRRVNWTGYHILTPDEAQQFTVEYLLNGNSWLPSTGVPFKLGG